MVTLLVACGSDASNDDRTLEDMIQVYENEGIEIDRAEKPIFEMIEARDGIIFKMDGNKVAIYEYDSTKALNDAKEKYDLMMDGNLDNGRFSLETNNEQAKEIFTSIE